MIALSDTIIFQNNDSIYQVSDAKSQIILLQGQRNNTTKAWYEETVYSSVVFPIIVAILTAYLLNKINARKNKADLEKVIEETDQMKRSFQPAIFSAIHSIQEKLLDKRLEALKSLTEIRNNIISYDPKYTEDEEPYYPREQELLEILFKEFKNSYFESFKKFLSEYAYLFPKSMIERNSMIKERLEKIVDDTYLFWAAFDGNPKVAVGFDTTNYLSETIRLIEESISEIRKECLLDESFVKDFINANKIGR